MYHVAYFRAYLVNIFNALNTCKMNVRVQLHPYRAVIKVSGHFAIPTQILLKIFFHQFLRLLKTFQSKCQGSLKSPLRFAWKKNLRQSRRQKSSSNLQAVVGRSSSSWSSANNLPLITQPKGPFIIYVSMFLPIFDYPCQHVQ